MALLRSLGSQQVRKCIQQKLCQPTIASSRRTKLTLVRRISQPTDGVTAAIQRKAEGARVKDVTWSANQRPRSQIISGPRFEQTNLDAQPHPLPSYRIDKETTGGGALGHPKIFINLDKPGPKPCGYCGLRFERSHDGHH
ncbi:hypothetical protein PSHT_12568 [Puccinia striiformis]|uniref:Zinc finger CHCC-type domain-containing protein n=1 Tax=Puccinia striiformis TaxID=27350 RepID=A0A2S4UVT1_9BASI|nr:hypothetical protein PSHT_12568 [Puccinia striiformis]